MVTNEQATPLTSDEIAHRKEVAIEMLTEWRKDKPIDSHRSDLKDSQIVKYEQELRYLATIDAISARLASAEKERDDWRLTNESTERQMRELEAYTDILKCRPTEWAYEQACAALEKHRTKEREAIAERDALRGAHVRGVTVLHLLQGAARSVPAQRSRTDA